MESKITDHSDKKPSECFRNNGTFKTKEDQNMIMKDRDEKGR